MLCRRDSVEQFDQESSSKTRDDVSSGRNSPDYTTPSDDAAITKNGDNIITGNDQPPRPNSALAKLEEGEDSPVDEDQDCYETTSDIIRRKSMPALRRHKVNLVEEDGDSSGSTGSKEGVARTLSLKPEHLQKPIITITQDSPEPSITGSSWFQSKRESLASDKSDDGGKSIPLTRSYTDSDIS